MTGGQDEDVYANTNGIVRWVKDRQAEHALVNGLGCAGGRHELDNEAEPMGASVRTAAARFATWAVTGGNDPLPTSVGGGCESY